MEGLESEINAILSDKETESPLYEWQIYFKIKDTYTEELIYEEEVDKDTKELEKESRIYWPLKLLNLDWRDNYETASSREMWATIVMSFGMWVKHIYPAREHITTIIKKRPLKVFTHADDPDREDEEWIYDTIFHIDKDNSFEGVDYTGLSRFDLDNRRPPVTLQLEILDRSVELARKVTVGGIWRNILPEDFIRFVLGHFTEELEIEGEPAIERVTVVEASNQTEREHILIPQGLPLLDVPVYMQKNCGGVYNAGLNCYAIGKDIFVYPLYDPDRFEKEDKTLTVIRVEKSFANQYDISHRLEEKALYVLATSNSELKEVSYPVQMSKGNGVRYNDSRGFLNKYVKNKDNKSEATRTNFSSEYKAVERREQDAVFVSRDRIHSNPFKQRSDLTKAMGGSYRAEWINSVPELMYPGMPARILFSKDGEIVEYRGSLLYSETSITSLGEGFTTVRYGCTTSMVFYITPYERNTE